MIRGAPVAMAKKTRDRRKGQAMMRDMMARNERSNNASARNRPVRYGTTSKAEAEAMAAKLAAERAAGQKRRKAF